MQNYRHDYPVSFTNTHTHAYSHCEHTLSHVQAYAVYTNTVLLCLPTEQVTTLDRTSICKYTA